MRGFSYCQSQPSGFEVVIDAAGFVGHASNLLAQSPVVAAIRARETIDGFGMTEACFTPVNAIEIGKQAVLGLQRVGLDSVNARLFREVELPTISLVEIDACSYTSNEDEIAKHSRLHSNQEHDHEDHEVGPRFDVFEVDHSGLLLALLGGVFVELGATPNGCLHPVSNGIGQLFRPLTDRRSSDADSVGGCGNGAAQQFNGF